MATTQPGWGLGLLGVATLELVPAPPPNPQCCQLLISGLRAQDDSAKSLVKEVVLSVEIAKYYFKEATEQRDSAIRRGDWNPGPETCLLVL